MKAIGGWVKIEKADIRAGEEILIGDLGTARRDGAEDMDQSPEQLNGRSYYRRAAVLDG